MEFSFSISVPRNINHFFLKTERILQLMHKITINDHLRKRKMEFGRHLLGYTWVVFLKD